MEKYIKIAVLDDQFEAQLLESVLKERGIPHLLRSYYDTAFDGLFQTQKGWGYISAPPEFSKNIEKIIAELRKDKRLNQNCPG
ncbi:MAG: hypothetical protein JXA35_10810 [Deltaproteobacteria bacterium]|nr:hypothetical protein [Deltaproteobacteria bacterium]